MNGHCTEQLLFILFNNIKSYTYEKYFAFCFGTLCSDMLHSPSFCMSRFRIRRVENRLRKNPPPPPALLLSCHVSL